MTIQVTYTPVNGEGQNRLLITEDINTAMIFAYRWAGSDAVIQGDNAFSSDGVGIVRVRGASLEELFDRQP